MAAVLVLTGPPAIGKSTTARGVALTRDRAAVVDVDDVRQLVVSGHAAPWQGEEGRRQQRLGVENACRLAAALAAGGFDVVVSDVVDHGTLDLYRTLLPAAPLLRLTADDAVLAARTAGRPAYLRPDELDQLLQQERDDPVPADLVLDVGALDQEQQVAAVLAGWHPDGAPR